MNYMNLNHEMKRKVYITIGLPGSGKSTWAEYMARQDSKNKIISGDVIREMLSGRYLYDDEWEWLIEDLKRNCIKILLEMSSCNIIIDDCHVTRDCRRRLCEFVHSIVNNAEVIYVVFKCSKNSSIEKRGKSTKGYPKYIWGYVIEKLEKLFEDPNSDAQGLVSEVINYVNK